MFTWSDDVLVYSKSFEEHLHHVELVVKAMSEAGLRLNPTKCSFLKSEIKYLGHVVTRDGLKPNNDQVLAIEKF